MALFHALREEPSFHRELCGLEQYNLSCLMPRGQDLFLADPALSSLASALGSCILLLHLI